MVWFCFNKIWRAALAIAWLKLFWLGCASITDTFIFFPHPFMFISFFESLSNDFSTSYFIDLWVPWILTITPLAVWEDIYANTGVEMHWIFVAIMMFSRMLSSLAAFPTISLLSQKFIWHITESYNVQYSVSDIKTHWAIHGACLTISTGWTWQRS